MAALCTRLSESLLNRLFTLRSAFLRYKEPMKNRLRMMLVACAVLLIHGSLRASDAEPQHDHDRARQALLAGEILPLKTILDRVEREQPGQVMEVELEQKSAGWMYEIKLLQAEGRLIKLYVDARSGDILRLKQKRQRAFKGNVSVQEPH